VVFSAAVGAEKAEDLAAVHAQINAVDDRAITKTLGNALNVDDRFWGRLQFEM
jgi:hypothetical protein